MLFALCRCSISRNGLTGMTQPIRPIRSYSIKLLKPIICNILKRSSNMCLHILCICFLVENNCQVKFHQCYLHQNTFCLQAKQHIYAWVPTETWIIDMWATLIKVQSKSKRNWRKPSKHVEIWSQECQLSCQVGKPHQIKSRSFEGKSGTIFEICRAAESLPR